MKTWDIKVLYAGKITANFALLWPTGMPPLEEDFVVDVPYLAFLLQSPGENILVDTGISEKFIVDGKAWGGLPAEGGQDHIKKSLEKEGLSPGDINTVVFTHLHNDHAGNFHLFPQARFLFQKEEWMNLLNPLPVQLLRKDYDPGLIDGLKDANTLRVEGDFDLTDGVKVYKTPGHSLGSQVVAVNTVKGVVALIGDLSVFNYMIFPGTTEFLDLEGNSHAIPPAPPIFGPAVPHSIIYDFYAFYDSVYKVKSIISRDEPGYIITGHDPSLVVQGI